ncbi:hypothetical protein AGOR_G00014170 [Albula goreensis]|uniref:lysozyme n=1 Tax=Albula goreensis TaxID=1534307 RepID=A0A8T3E730_9TELE|nr:hypothetical protein AGOR_G00014170 [Albula goreensis]
MRALVFLFLVAAANAKVFTQCEIAKVFKNAGMDGYRGRTGTISLDDWVCTAYHESRYKTDAFNDRNRDGTKDYGIFQINNHWWCTDGHPSHNGCKISCSSLLNDDISDDIRCAKQVAREQGIVAWNGWKDFCKGKDISHFTRDCGL